MQMGRRSNSTKQNWSHLLSDAIQSAPAIVGGAGFTKMFGWGMEIMMFTTYSTTLKKWYRNIELCRGEVKNLTGMRFEASGGAFVGILNQMNAEVECILKQMSDGVEHL